MKVRKEFVIDSDINSVWDVVGNQFAKVHKWSSNFSQSQPGGQPKLSGVDYLHRDTITARGQTLQELDAFDPRTHSLAYHISKGIPKPAKKASGFWSMDSLSPSQTKVVLEFHMVPANPLVSLLSPLIKKKLSKAAGEMVEELKCYVETGQPHSRKLNQ
jgi:hypothetical protein